MRILNVQRLLSISLTILLKRVEFGEAELLEFIYSLPWLIQAFDQVLFFSDCSMKTQQKSFRRVKEFTESKQEFGLHFSWSMTPSAFTEIQNVGDPHYVTAIIVPAPGNFTFLDELLNQVVNSEHWNYFFFFVWPTRNLADFLDVVTNVSLQFPLHSDIFWVLEGDSNLQGHERFSLWETYSVKNVPIVQPILGAVHSTSFFFDLMKYKWRRRRDFRRAVVTATAVVDPDYEDEVKFAFLDTGSMILESGLSVDIYRIFRDQLNFTENCIEGDYMLGKNPDVPGMEVQLLDGSADISIAESTVSEDKAEVIQMIHATTATWLEARFEHESGSQFKFFKRPFTREIWLMLMIYLIVLVILFQLIHYFAYKLTRAYGYRRIPSAVMGALWAIGSICSKSCCTRPKSRPLKILFLVASVIGYLLSSSYSAEMTSQLSVKDESKVTLDVLLDSHYQFYVEEDVSFPVDLRQFPKWWGVVVMTIVNANDFFDVTDDVSTTKSAVISFPEYFHATMRFGNFSDAEACTMYETIRVSTVPTLCSMAVNKSSPFKEIFNIKTLSIMERGMLHRLYRRHKSGSVLQCTGLPMKLVPQTLEELLLAYVILWGGTLFGLIIMFCEKLGHCIYNRKLPSGRASKVSLNPVIQGIDIQLWMMLSRK